MPVSSKINREWHGQNRMPKNATLDQRVEWHLAHLKACSCRTDLPPKIRDQIEKRRAST